MYFCDPFPLILSAAVSQTKSCLLCHTCDKLQKGISEIVRSFRGGFSKMYRIYRKILNSDAGDFEILVKSGVLEEILGLISGSLPDDQGGFTCMLCNF